MIPGAMTGLAREGPSQRQKGKGQAKGQRAMQCLTREGQWEWEGARRGQGQSREGES